MDIEDDVSQPEIAPSDSAPEAHGRQQDILDFNREELRSELSTSMGLEGFRSRQLIQWLYKRRAQSFETMTDISRPVRRDLPSATASFARNWLLG